MSDLSPFSMMMGKKVQKTLHILYILNVRAAVQYISFMDGLFDSYILSCASLARGQRASLLDANQAASGLGRRP